MSLLWRQFFQRLSKSRRHIHRRRARLCPERLESRRLLAVFNVDTINDTVAANLVSGVDANGDVSLRSAIMAANSLGGSHTINVDNLPSVIPLTITGRGENFAATGDLDIRANITIQSVTGGSVDAQGIDRVFDVQGIGALTLRGLFIAGGNEVQGGAIFNRGTLLVDGADVVGTAGSVGPSATPTNGYGGAILNSATGTATLVNSFIQGQAFGSSAFLSTNSAGGRGGHAYGGAIYNVGQLTIDTTQVNGLAVGGNGGDGGNGAPGLPATTNSAATNGASGYVGGAGGYAYGASIYNGATGTITLRQASIDGEASGGAGGNGGIGGQGGTAGAGQPAGTSGIGGDGGSGGLAYGGGIYNTGGTVDFTAGDQGFSLVHARAFGGLGGNGGAGGTGGTGATGASGSNGATGGRGAVGGAATGGAIYMYSGIMNIRMTNITGVTEAIYGSFGGPGGRGGDGGSGPLIFALPGLSGGGNSGVAGRGGNAEGAGIYVRDGQLTMNDGNIQDLTAGGGGGGSSGAGGAATLGPSGSAVNGVTGGAAIGGGLSVRGGTVGFDLVNFSNLIAFGGDGGTSADGMTAGMGGSGQGGGVHIAAGALSLSQSNFDGNRAYGGSGGVALNNTLGVEGTNGGIGGNGQGGAMAALGGSVTVEIVTFNLNSAGGGLGSDGSIGNVYFQPTEGQVGGDGGRGGVGYGGAIYATAATVSLANVTIDGNMSAGGGGGNGGPASPLGDEPFGLSGGDGLGRGGGIYHAGTGVFSTEAVTISRNLVSDERGSLLGSGGGIFNLSGTFQTLSTLIGMNQLSPAMTSTTWDAVGNFTSLGHNLISVRNGTTGFTATGDKRGSSAAPLDPLLGPLEFNGGPTKTVSLFAGSPAIDAGSTGLQHDQAGNERRFEPDIGAFEYWVVFT